MQQVLQQTIDDFCASAGSPGVILEVQAPLHGENHALATGVFSRASGRPLRPDDGFRIASMSKTFTAVLVLQQMERGQIDLQAPVLDYVRLPAMPIEPGCNQRDITVEMLLNHTAGLWDFAQADAWGAEVQRAPATFRPPRQTLEWALSHGEPVGKPGQHYHYSDTGYVILGLLLEAVTGRAWGDLVRREIIDTVGMDHTWLEGYESPRSTLSHPYIGRFDGLNIHGSVDWAAGGHVSTTADLCRFMQALCHGQLYSNLATLDTMLGGVPLPEGGFYGAGVRLRDASGWRVWGHGGFWGSAMVYVPAERITLAATVNRVAGSVIDLVDEVVALFQAKSVIDQ